jgi:LacI family transcriptional regulator
VQVRRPGRATLRAVAEHAKVSVMTVSNVVNSRFGNVSEETRLRVTASIEALNYVPNVSARTVRLRRSYAFGLLVIEASPLYLADPFISQCAAGLSNRFNAAGYKLMIQGLILARSTTRYISKICRGWLCVILPGGRTTRKEGVRYILSRAADCLPSETLIPNRSYWCNIGFDQASAANQCGLSFQSGTSLLTFLSRVEWPAIEERHSRLSKLPVTVSGLQDRGAALCGR